MIRSRAPLRISFGGGGTDIPPYCDEHGGVCLAVTIDKYAYAEYGKDNTKPSRMEQEICRLWNNIGKLKIRLGVKPMSGLGGSAALCIAGLKAIPALEDETPEGLAKLAYEVERLGIGVMGGYQDQIASAYGGLLYMQFGGWPNVRVKRLTIPEGFEDLFYLVYLGKRADSGPDVIADQLQRFNKRALDLSKQIANEMALSLKEPVTFGQLLEEAWQVKKEYSPLVTNKKIDDFHDWAIENGAIAMKICGAGSGGYALIMAEPRDPGIIAEALIPYDYEKVKFVERGAEIIGEE